jgi:hypothetical protein
VRKLVKINQVKIKAGEKRSPFYNWLLHQIKNKKGAIGVMSCIGMS